MKQKKFDAASAYTMFEEWYELCIENDIDPKDIVEQDGTLRLFTSDGDLVDAHEQYMLDEGITMKMTPIR